MNNSGLNIKKYLSLFLAVAIIATMLTACGSTEKTPDHDSAEPNASSTAGDAYEYPELKITLTAQSREDDNINITSKFFKDLVEEYSGGRITFEEYWNGSLVAAADQLASIGEGISQVGNCVTLYTTSELPLSQIVNCIPFTSADPEVVIPSFEKLYRACPEIQAEYEAAGVKLLSVQMTPSYDIYTTKDDALTYDDIRGMKIAASGIYFSPYFEAAGATSVTMNITDAYNSLNSNVIDAIWAATSLASDSKIYEVCKTRWVLDFGARANIALVMNLDLWNSVDDETRALFERCAQEANEMYIQWLNKVTDETWLPGIYSRGIREVVMTDMEKDRWGEEPMAYKDTLKMWIDQVTSLGYDGTEIMSQYIAIQKELGTEFKFDTSAYE